MFKNFKTTENAGLKLFLFFYRETFSCTRARIYTRTHTRVRAGGGRPQVVVVMVNKFFK